MHAAKCRMMGHDGTMIRRTLRKRSLIDMPCTDSVLITITFLFSLQHFALFTSVSSSFSPSIYPLGQVVLLASVSRE